MERLCGARHPYRSRMVQYFYVYLEFTFVQTMRNGLYNTKTLKILVLTITVAFCLIITILYFAYYRNKCIQFR